MKEKVLLIILFSFLQGCAPLEPTAGYCLEIDVAEKGTNLKVSDFTLIVETCNGKNTFKSEGTNTLEVKLPGGCETRAITLELSSRGYKPYLATIEEDDLWCTNHLVELEPWF